MDKDKLIQAQKEYIEFLSKGVGKLESYLVTKGMFPNEEDVEKGEILRQNIKNLE